MRGLEDFPENLEEFLDGAWEEYFKFAYDNRPDLMSELKELKRMGDRLDSLTKDEGSPLADEILSRFKAVLQELHIEFEARKHPVS